MRAKKLIRLVHTGSRVANYNERNIWSIQWRLTRWSSEAYINTMEVDKVVC
jgi:hypothetical protein